MKVSANFSLEEFLSDDDTIKVTALLYFHVEKLQRLRDRFGSLVVTSGYRNPKHNKRVGGAVNSMHLDFATDLVPVTGVHYDDMAALALQEGFTGIGRYHNFIHLDCRQFIGRPPARWDNR